MKTEVLSGLQIVGISTTVENNTITQNQLIKRQKNYLEKKKIKNSSNIIGVKKNFFTSTTTYQHDL